MEDRFLAEELHFGGVALYKTICPYCEKTNLFEKLTVVCRCSLEYTMKVGKTKSISSGVKRKTIGKELKRKLIKKQNNRCYWCDIEFGTYYIKNENKICRLDPVGDHIIPYSFSETNVDDNFVISCNRCNSYKHSKMFAADEDCRDYLIKRWKRDLKSGRVSLV